MTQDMKGKCFHCLTLGFNSLPSQSSKGKSKEVCNMAKIPLEIGNSFHTQDPPTKWLNELWVTHGPKDIYLNF